MAVDKENPNRSNGFGGGCRGASAWPKVRRPSTAVAPGKFMEKHIRRSGRKCASLVTGKSEKGTGADLERFRATR